MLVCNDSHEPWTIIEALRISGKSKSDWDKHLDKLSVNYNTSGFSTLYLLTYVDADIPVFPDIWKSYREHIQTHDPSQRKYVGGSFVDLDVPNSQHIKAAKCCYSSGGDSTTVYHIFARIPTQNG